MHGETKSLVWNDWSTSGLVMDISLRSVSMHYIRIHFGYAPRTHILKAI